MEPHTRSIALAGGDDAEPLIALSAVSRSFHEGETEHVVLDGVYL
jgi:hypothetical protein